MGGVPERLGSKPGRTARCARYFFQAATSPSVHSLQRPENINNLYPSLRLDGKASKRQGESGLALDAQRKAVSLFTASRSLPSAESSSSDRALRRGTRGNE